MIKSIWEWEGSGGVVEGAEWREGSGEGAEGKGGKTIKTQL